jgi:hypothetical protein
MVEVQYEEMKKHATTSDCWMAIHGKVRLPLSSSLLLLLSAAATAARSVLVRAAGVPRQTCGDLFDMQVYDVTKFLDEHPGGSEVMMEVAGPLVLALFLPYLMCQCFLL